MEVDLTGVLMGIAWGLVGVFVVLAGIVIYKNQVLKFQIKTLDVDDVTKRLKLKEQYIKDLEDEIDGYREELDQTKQEVASWTGKYHQKGQIKKLPADKYDLSKKSDIGIVTEDVLDQITPHLSSDLQQTLNDPKIRSLIINYANEHPDEAVEYVKRFIGTTGKKGGNTQPEIIPGFDSSKAI